MFSRTAFRKMGAGAVQDTVGTNTGTHFVNVPLMMSTGTILIAGGRWVGSVETRLNNLEENIKDLRRIVENFDGKLDKIMERKR